MTINLDFLFIFINYVIQHHRTSENAS